MSIDSKRARLTKIAKDAIGDAKHIDSKSLAPATVALAHNAVTIPNTTDAERRRLVIVVLEDFIDLAPEPERTAVRALFDLVAVPIIETTFEMASRGTSGCCK